MYFVSASGSLSPHVDDLAMVWVLANMKNDKFHSTIILVKVSMQCYPVEFEVSTVFVCSVKICFGIMMLHVKENLCVWATQSQIRYCTWTYIHIS